MTFRILATAAAAVAAGTATLALATRQPAAAGPALPDGMAPVALPVELVPVVRETHYGVLESHAGRVVNRRSSALGFDRSADFAARSIAEARAQAEGQKALEAFLQRKPAPWTGGDDWPGLPAIDEDP